MNAASETVALLLKLFAPSMLVIVADQVMLLLCRIAVKLYSSRGLRPMRPRS